MCSTILQKISVNMHNDNLILRKKIRGTRIRGLGTVNSDLVFARNLGLEGKNLRINDLLLILFKKFRTNILLPYALGDSFFDQLCF
jgi:hypothetical protein